MWNDDYMEKTAEILKKINDDNDSQWMIVTIDSDSGESTTPERDEIFEMYNFSRDYKGTPLPRSTYIGKIPSLDAEEPIIEEIWQKLKVAGLAPRRICGGIINEPLIIRSPDDPD